MDSSQLEQVVSKIADGQYGDIDSLLVLRNNYLVLEHYFSPQYHGQDYRQPIKSVTKSVTSALFGIARDQGKLPDLHSKLLDLLPLYADIDHLDSRKRAIRLEHVLSMTAGFEWNEWTGNSSFKMERSKDWMRYVLDLPMSHAPGETLAYSSGCSILLSGILQQATGEPVSEFARKNLFEPIDIASWGWTLAPGNVTNTAVGLQMTRRDMARFGVLFLNQGRWQGRQIVAADWVRQSTAVKILGKGEYFPYAYAYQWWRLQDEDPTIRSLVINDLYFALGFGGQFILVVPHLDMVVVSTASNFGADELLFFKLLRDHVFPAVLLD